MIQRKNESAVLLFIFECQSLIRYWLERQRRPVGLYERRLQETLNGHRAGTIARSCAFYKCACRDLNPGLYISSPLTISDRSRTIPLSECS